MQEEEEIVLHCSLNPLWISVIDTIEFKNMKKFHSSTMELTTILK